jgi:transcriptional regulator with XRE-family HTH domain
MADFGQMLRSLRLANEWRQQDLVDRLQGQIARSTLANVETSRERPSPRLWALLRDFVPEWSGDLAPHYETARRRAEEEAQERRERAVSATIQEPERYELGGPFTVELLQFVYVFRHSRAPEEIIETRRVRAMKAGADGYGLKLTHTDSAVFNVDEEALWGGHISSNRHYRNERRTHYLRRFEFGRRLRRGQIHEFAVRSWIERDPEPGTEVMFSVTLPTERAAIHLNFRGPERPRAVWQYGPVVDEDLTPQRPDGEQRLDLTPDGTASAYFPKPETGLYYGAGWQW